jgi:hypothetical protein
MCDKMLASIQILGARAGKRIWRDDRACSVLGSVDSVAVACERKDVRLSSHRYRKATLPPNGRNESAISLNFNGRVFQHNPREADIRREPTRRQKETRETRGMLRHRNSSMQAYAATDLPAGIDRSQW